MSTIFTANYTRMARSSMIEQLQEEHVRTAEAKGMSRGTSSSATPGAARSSRSSPSSAWTSARLSAARMITELTFGLRRHRPARRRLGHRHGPARWSWASCCSAPPSSSCLQHHRGRRVRRSSTRACGCPRRPPVTTSPRPRTPRPRPAPRRVPLRTRPVRAVLHRGRHRQGRRRALLRPRARQDPRHRRRVRLRQVGDQPGRARPAQPAKTTRSAARSCSTARS